MQKLVLLGFFCSFLAIGSIHAQEVAFGAPNKESAFHHFPVIYSTADDGSFSVLHLTKVKPSAMHLMKDQGNKKAMVSSTMLGYGKITTDRAINDPENYMSGKGLYFIEQYDAAANQTKKTALDLKYESEFLIVKKIYKRGDVTRVIVSYYNEKTKKTHLYATVLNEDDKLEKEDMKELDHSDYKFGSPSWRNTYKVVLSEDGTKLLVAVWGFKSGKEYKKFLRIKVLDAETFDVLSEEDASMNAYEKIYMEDLRFTNDGSAYFLTKIYLNDEEKEDEENKQPYKFMLFCHTANSELANAELLFSGKYISNATLDIKDNNLLVMGFLSNKSVTFQDGYFFKMYKPGGLEEISSLESSFSEDFRTEFIGAKNASKNKELKDYRMRKIFKDGSGNLIMVAERFWIEATSDGSSSSLIATSYTFQYNYLDMMVFSLDPKSGDIKWFKKIKKNQRTVDDGGIYSTFSAHIEGNQLRLIYNANKKDPEALLTNPASSTSYAATVNCADGSVAIQPIFNAKEEKTVMVPLVRAKTRDNRWILYTVKGTQFRFGYLSF